MATTFDEPPRETFRLSMLLYDTRYRSITIQIIFLFLFMAGAAWLIHNAVENLRALGKDFNFGFLWARAGYDINQRPIDYTNDSTHFRAMLVGLLNTLILAVLGCITATIIGVVMGVLRLSNNWVVSRLAAVYVDVFRNIPLLIWILVVFAVISESMPAPNAFRGENPAATMKLFDSVALTNRGIYIAGPVFERGLGSFSLGPFSVNLNFLAILLVLVLGWLVHRTLTRHAEATQNATGVRPVIWWKSLLVFVLPLIALLWALGFHLDYPVLRGFNFQGGIYLRDSLIAMWVALSLYTGAFITETVRGGILSVSRGQTEAAFALGIRPSRTMRLVILPQALRVIIPPLISQYLNLTKNTSLALAVGYMDLRSTLGGITLNQTGRELEAMLLMMLIYLVISLVVSGAMNVYNQRTQLRGR